MIVHNSGENENVDQHEKQSIIVIRASSARYPAPLLRQQ
jgi:hypothetical protein